MKSSTKPTRFIAAMITTVFLGGSLNSHLLLPVVVADETETAEDAKAKATRVTLKDLTLTLPATWKVSNITSTMRLATYDIPRAEGDPEDGEMVVSSFPGGGGGVDENLIRWIGQFSAEGRTASLRRGKAGDNTYYIADISGTYQKPKGPPVLRQTEAAPGFRMLGVILELDGKGVYFLKMTGPDATVKAQSEAFRKSFGASQAEESEYEI